MHPGVHTTVHGMAPCPSCDSDRVKNPLDTAHWALTMGILLGAGQFLLAGIVVVGIALLIFLLGKITAKGGLFLLVIRCRPGGCRGASGPEGCKGPENEEQDRLPQQGGKTIELRVDKGTPCSTGCWRWRVWRSYPVAYQSETV